MPSTQVRLLLRSLLLGPFFSAALFLVSLTPLVASLPVSFLRCYVRCAFAVGKSEMSVTFGVPTTQVRLLLRQRLVCPFSAVLLLVSLTPFASLPASFLRCDVWCSCVVSRSVVSVTFLMPSTQVRLLLRLRLLCSLLLCVFASGLCYSPCASLSASFLDCYVRCSFSVSKSVMSFTFVVHSTQVRLLLRLRLLCPFVSAVLLLFSLTPLVSLPASFLRCYVSCAFVVSRSVVSVTFVIHTTQVRLLLRQRLLCRFPAVLLLVSLTTLVSLLASFLHCYVKCSLSAGKSVMSLTFVVPSPQIRMFFHQRPRGPLISAVLRLDSLTPLPPYLLLFCAAMVRVPLLSVGLLCRLRL